MEWRPIKFQNFNVLVFFESPYIYLDFNRVFEIKLDSEKLKKKTLHDSCFNNVSVLPTPLVKNSIQ